MQRQEEESKLWKRIADKRKLIEKLRKSGSADAAGEDNTPRLTIKDLPKMDFSDAGGRTPLDEFLAGWEDQPQFRPTDSIWQRAGAREGGVTVRVTCTSYDVSICKYVSSTHVESPY